MTVGGIDLCTQCRLFGHCHASCEIERLSLGLAALHLDHIALLHRGASRGLVSTCPQIVPAIIDAGLWIIHARQRSWPGIRPIPPKVLASCECLIVMLEFEHKFYNVLHRNERGPRCIESWSLMMIQVCARCWLLSSQARDMKSPVPVTGSRL